ncbi:helix-turn-helix domain-containing protein [Bosea sp. Root483D1]|uniref:helix-turn-helix domain-containing protein n=1 Tax=Bosea sp. Root483D1 TaxID=1736544 RepID=UPI0039B8A247
MRGSGVRIPLAAPSLSSIFSLCPVGFRTREPAAPGFSALIANHEVSSFSHCPPPCARSIPGLRTGAGVRIKRANFPSFEHRGCRRRVRRNDHSGVDRSHVPLVAPMDLKDVLAANLHRLLRERQLTQEGLAERAGINSRYVGAVERADVSASVTVLGLIADALGVEPSELLRLTRRTRG